MHKHSLLSVCVASAALVACTALLTVAGPLSPPVGPVASTYKTLTEVEPRIAINAANTPGDAGSLFVISQPGSYYLTGNITGVAGKIGIRISTGGVTVDLAGFVVQGVAGSLSGITSSGFQANIRVERGTVRNWGQNGVQVFGDNSILRDLLVTNNGASGIDAASSFHPRIEGCVALANGGATAAPSIVGGIGSLILNCSVTGAQGAGIRLGSSSRAESCTVVGSTLQGFIATNQSTVIGCTSANNEGAGILVLGNDVGVADSRFINNGINAALPADQRAGILVTASRARIENNTITLSGGPGIRLSGAGNIATRNALAANTGGTISAVAGNWVAPIVPAAGAAANTNGNANLEY